MASKYHNIKAELDNDPLARGYAGMTDAQAAADLNTSYRDGPPDGIALLQYVTLEKFRTGNLYGRIQMVANTSTLRAGNSWEIPPLPLGVSGADIVPTHDQVAAAAAFIRILDVDIAETVSMLDSRIDSILTDLSASGCQAIGAGDKTAIQNLSTGVLTRGLELGFGTVKESHVTFARAL